MHVMALFLMFRFTLEQILIKLGAFSRIGGNKKNSNFVFFGFSEISGRRVRKPTLQKQRPYYISC